MTHSKAVAEQHGVTHKDVAVTHLLRQARLIEQGGGVGARHIPLVVVVVEDELVLGEVVRADHPGWL